MDGTRELLGPSREEAIACKIEANDNRTKEIGFLPSSSALTHRDHAFSGPRLSLCSL